MLLILMAAPVFPTGALALSGMDPLLYADLDRADFAFEYVPQANSDYSVYLLSADGGDVQGSVVILENGEVIAEGEGTGNVCTVWLARGVKYTVRVHGSGNAVIEVARSALSRCFALPLAARENVLSEKMIAHEYDAHWYAFEAEADGEMMLSCMPEDAKLRMEALLFDDTGALLGAFEALPGGACRLKYATRAGETYYVRVCAPDGGEGYYALGFHRPDGKAPVPGFDAAEHVIAAGSQIDLAAEAGEGALLWISGAPDVAAVTRDGVVHGLRTGEALVTVYGMNGDASCRIRVEHVPLEGLDVLGEELRLNAGDDAEIHVELIPEDASDRQLYYRVEDPAIAVVSRSGVLRALQPGETNVIVASADGAISDRIRLSVAPAVRKYRALLVGEESYPFAENQKRSGSENSVMAIESLLGTVRFENAAYSVRARKDLSKSELIAQIRTAFRDASEQDVSLLYITCHGSFTGGMSFLELSDGSSLAVRDLERELRRIPGTVVVLIDCCGSGGAIGSASDRVAFARGVTGAFSGPSIRGSKYKVIASAGLDQDSFRIAFNENADTGVMATVFARVLCDGAGWNIDNNARGTMGADRNYDGSITLGELQEYMAARVNWYLDIASDLTGEDYRQSVQVYPEGDPLILFERKSR